jgi:hypothetical protein
MGWLSNAPQCFVVDCEELAALADTAKGRLWQIESYYCSDCYTALQAGEERRIDLSRLVLRSVSAVTAGQN